MNASLCHEAPCIIFIKRLLTCLFLILFFYFLLPKSVGLHAIKRTIGENFKRYEKPNYVK